MTCQLSVDAWLNRPFKSRYNQSDSVKTLVAGPALREQHSAGHVTTWPGRWVSPTTFACVRRGTVWVAKVGAQGVVLTTGDERRVEGGEAAVRAAYSDDKLVSAMFVGAPEDFII